MKQMIFLFLYLLMSVWHLYFSWKDDAKGRAFTKPFLLLLLIFFYLFSKTTTNHYLLLALITSWLGDVLLIGKGHKWFTLGGISFMFCHFFFILVYLQRIRFSVTYLLLLIVAILYYGIALWIIHSVKDNTPKKMLLPMYFYLICNSTMNIFALMQVLSLRNSGALVAYLGALLFYISDCTLFLVRYHRNKDLIFKKHFTVMLTYLSGEMLITVGILMMGG